MLPAARLTVLRRLPVTRAISQLHPVSYLDVAQLGSIRYASNFPSRKPAKSVLRFKKDEIKAASQSSQSQTLESVPGAREAQKAADAVEEEIEAAPVNENAPRNEKTPPQPSKPLPDLRYGIPSTFAAEYMKGQNETDPAAQRNLDITDADIETETPRSGAGGRGDGPLPKSAYESSIDKRRNKLAQYFFIAAALAGTAGAIWLGRDWATDEEERKYPDAPSGWSPMLFYNRIRARVGTSLGYYTEPTFPKLLPTMDPSTVAPHTLVFSLEDFLVHSEWTREHGWRTAKRPGADFFLLYLSQYYEMCLFTSVPMGIADPIVRKLDPYHLIMWPLFREATRYDGGDYVKDLSYLNRPIEKVLLLDTKAGHAKAQPENAIISAPWKGDPNDRGLFKLIPILEYIAIMGVEDVRTVLKSFEGKDIAEEFAIREAKMRERFASEIAEAQKNKRKKSGWSLAGLVKSVVKAPGGPQPGEPPSLVEALADGKTLLDVMREEGLKRYKLMEKEVRDNGERWMAEEAQMLKKMEAEQMKQMKKNPLSIFGIGPQAPIDPQKMMADAAREIAEEKEKSKELHVQEILNK